MRYTGVRPSGKGTFEVRVLPPGKKALYLGAWPTERAAAIIRDRVLLHFGLTDSLNLPKLSPLLGALSPEAARALGRSTTEPKSRSRSKHGYFGVGFWERNARRPWGARITVEGRTVMLGSWPTARAAAEAHDRAARYFGQNEHLNFPERTAELPSTDPRTIRAEAMRLRKKTSQYLGVCWGTARKAWLAQVRGRDGIVRAVGAFQTEKEAAIARDRAALEFQGPRARLNFDPKTGRRLKVSIR